MHISASGNWDAQVRQLQALMLSAAAAQTAAATRPSTVGAPQGASDTIRGVHPAESADQTEGSEDPDDQSDDTVNSAQDEDLSHLIETAIKLLLTAIGEFSDASQRKPGGGQGRQSSGSAVQKQSVHTHTHTQFSATSHQSRKRGSISQAHGGAAALLSQQRSVQAGPVTTTMVGGGNAASAAGGGSAGASQKPLDRRELQERVEKLIAKMTAIIDGATVKPSGATA